MKAVITPAILLLLCLSSQAQTDNSLAGVYTGKNLYIQKPTTYTAAPCILEVYINGDTLPQKTISQPAFEINFSSFGLKPGDSVQVRIVSYKDCMYKVLNPQTIVQRSMFNIVSMSVRNDTLYWTAVHEKTACNYIVEQFKWNKWTKIDEVQGHGGNDTAHYKLAIRPHSKKNKTRVRSMCSTGSRSNQVEFVSDKEPVIYKLSKDHNKIIFSAETQFELYDKYGHAIQRGTAKEIDVSSLGEGLYYLNYDDKMQKIKLRRKG